MSGFSKGLIKSLAIGVVLGLAAILFLEMKLAQSRARIAGLRADSLEAVADSLHLTVQDSTNFYTRRMLQVKIREDSFLKALALKPAVVLQPVFHFDTVQIVDTVPVVDSSGVRSAHWDLRQEPITAAIDVRMPQAAQATINFRATLDSLPLSVKVGCGVAPHGGVRPATAVISGPSWAKLQLGIPSADPNVCNARNTLNIGVPAWSAPIGGVIGFLLCVFVCH